MTSSPNELLEDGLFEIDEKSDAVAHFVTLVGSQLQSAFLRRKAEEGMTQQALANTLDVDRSRIHRCLSGYSNLTLESVAELVWALRGTPLFTIDLEDGANPHCNHFAEPRVLSVTPSVTSTTTSTSIVRSPKAWTRVNRLELAD